MAGTFSVGESKTRPGVYHRRYSVGGGEVAGALNGVGMGIIRANWGPLNRAVAFEPSTNVNAVFGSGNTEDLITEMFSGGISSGYFARCGTGGTAPTITLKDNAKADVVTITGAYVGDRAFSVSVRDSLTGDGRECIIYEGTTEFLKVTFEADTKEPAGLAAAINAATKDFVAKATAAGSGVMATVTQSAMTKGTQPTAAVSEYSAALDAFDAVRGNVICVDTDDAAVHALVKAYITRTFTGGGYLMGCVAENKGVEFDTRTTHAAAFNDEKMHYPQNGSRGQLRYDFRHERFARRGRRRIYPAKEEAHGQHRYIRCSRPRPARPRADAGVQSRTVPVDVSKSRNRALETAARPVARSSIKAAVAGCPRMERQPHRVTCKAARRWSTGQCADTQAQCERRPAL